jgi:hypothetical protein
MIGLRAAYVPIVEKRRRFAPDSLQGSVERIWLAMLIEVLGGGTQSMERNCNFLQSFPHQRIAQPEGCPLSRAGTKKIRTQHLATTVLPHRVPTSLSLDTYSI